MLDHYLGIDVGGTKTEVCLLSLANSQDFGSCQVLGRERMNTGRTTSLADFLERLVALSQTILSSKNLKMNDLKGIGIGIPGSIDPISNQMCAGSIPFFKDVPIQEPFRKAFGYDGPIVFDNDANCFALAEAYFGAGAQWAKDNGIAMSDLCMIGVTLGTGVGGGIIVRGELVRGRRGGAGEVGHMSLVPSGRPCYCGKQGCVEQYLSGQGFASMTIDQYRDYLVAFLSNLCNALDPHVIVLGGGVSTQMGIYTGLSTRLGQECFLTSNPPPVLPHEKGDSSGVMGAALLSFSFREQKAHS